MDIGLDKFIEMFEERFGRKATTALLALIGFGTASVMLHLAWVNVVRPIYGLIRRLDLPSIQGIGSNPSVINFINGTLAVITSILVVNSILLVFWAMGLFWWTIIDGFLEKKRQKKWWDKQHAEFLAKYPPVESPAIPAQQPPPTETLPQKSPD